MVVFATYKRQNLFVLFILDVKIFYLKCYHMKNTSGMVIFYFRIP